MFHTAGFFFGGVGINTGISKPFRKILMSLMELFCDFLPQICQVQGIIIVHDKKTAFAQQLDRVTDAGL